MNVLADIIQNIINFSVPMLLVAIGGMYAHRSGILNVSYEGSMIAGALVGACVIHFLGKILPAQIVFILAILSALVAGGIYACFHAFLCVGGKTDPKICGMTLNIFSAAAALFIIETFSENASIDIKKIFAVGEIPLLSDIPFVGDILFKDTYLTTYVSILLLIISSVLLYKTSFGLRLRCCGDNPKAALAAGLKVIKYRYAAELIAGMLSAVSGLTLVVTAFSSFRGSVGGYGYLAIVVLIIGAWKPLRVFALSIIFGAVSALSGIMAELNIMPEMDNLWNMAVFVFALVLIAVFNPMIKKPKELTKQNMQQIE